MKEGRRQFLTRFGVGGAAALVVSGMAACTPQPEGMRRLPLNPFTPESTPPDRGEALFRAEVEKIAVKGPLSLYDSQKLAKHAETVQRLFPDKNVRNFYIVGNKSIATAATLGSRFVSTALNLLENDLRNMGIDPDSYKDQEVIQSQLLLVQNGVNSGSNNTTLVIIPDERLPLKKPYVIEGSA